MVGCSKEDAAASKPQRLVPTTAAEVKASPGYKLERTTASGIQCYVRPLTPEIARSIPMESPEYEYLKGDDQSPYYLLVLIRKEKIIDTEAASAGAMTAAEGVEVMAFVTEQDAKMQQMLKEAAKKTATSPP